MNKKKSLNQCNCIRSRFLSGNLTANI